MGEKMNTARSAIDKILNENDRLFDENKRYKLYLASLIVANGDGKKINFDKKMTEEETITMNDIIKSCQIVAVSGGIEAISPSDLDEGL